jgi:radical SAM superfamily enzyme YgiQ (UPF0313 family)
MNVIIFTGVGGNVFQRSIGAYQIAHNLRNNGFSCQVIDFVDHMSHNELLSLSQSFIDSSTLCIGMSSTFFSNINFVGNSDSLPLIIPNSLEKVCKEIKEKNPTIKIAIGGAKSNHGVNYSWIDSIFNGYSEDSFTDYIQLLSHSKKNHFVKTVNDKEIYEKENKNFNIVSLNHRFTKEDCITEGETLPIEISRGCIFKCKFCAYPLNGKKKLDYIRNYKCVKEELIYNYEHFRTTNYFFTDDTFNDSVEKIKGLHKIITSLDFKIKFVCYLRLDLLYAHPEVVPLLKEMGLATAYFGIESFNQESLKIIGKNINVEKIKKFLIDLNYEWNDKIPIFLGFIVGLPKENKINILQTVEWLKTTPFSFHFEPLRIKDAGSVYLSEFQKNYQKYGYTLTESGDWVNDTFSSHEAVLLCKDINDEYAYNKNKPAGWFLMALLNHMPLKEILSLRISDIRAKPILRTLKYRMEQYKNLLSEVAKNNVYRSI